MFDTAYTLDPLGKHRYFQRLVSPGDGIQMREDGSKGRFY